jgi:hypothetical protein
MGIVVCCVTCMGVLLVLDRDGMEAATETWSDHKWKALTQPNTRVMKCKVVGSLAGTFSFLESPVECATITGALPNYSQGRSPSSRKVTRSACFGRARIGRITDAHHGRRPLSSVSDRRIPGVQHKIGGRHSVVGASDALQAIDFLCCSATSRRRNVSFR